jgi:hypothetical protein
MNFLERIFRSNMVDCPRCLGKGHVDLEDIRRLKKELFWAPGKCAYCNGNGKVPPARIEKVSVDFEYLTTDLPSTERFKIINGDENAQARGQAFKASVENLVARIEHLYYIENKEPNEIAGEFMEEYGLPASAEFEKQEMVDYIERVINSKRKS